MKRAFTLIEMVVAVGILTVMISFAGFIFKVSIESQRLAAANAEIMHKFRAITEQLNADFKGLRKDGEIFIAWEVWNDPNLAGAPVRFDRIVFFANSDFHTYASPVVRGNVARISYMLARDATGRRPRMLYPQERMLARTQHILTADTSLASFYPSRDWFAWHNTYEYDKISVEQWKNISLDPLDPNNKPDILTTIVDIDLGGGPVTEGGTFVDPSDPALIHSLLCDGVGEFMVQGWNDTVGRWVPEAGDFANATSLPIWLLYRVRDGSLNIGGDFGPLGATPYPLANVKQPYFDYIPGLGRALKFTFTLYDSKGIIKGGRTFTHIVYLD